MHNCTGCGTPVPATTTAHPYICDHCWEAFWSEPSPALVTA